MEMEIINDKIFTKLYLKIRVKRLERIDLLITASVNKICKITIFKPPFLIDPLPFN